MPAYTLAEAAALLGITADGVRKRIERGTLQGFKSGRQWRVIMDAEPDNRTTQPDVSDSKDELIRELRARLVEQKQEIEKRDQWIQELMARLPPALPAPSPRAWWHFWRR